MVLFSSAKHNSKKKRDKGTTTKLIKEKGPKLILTKKDFVSEDPVERRLLPLLKKICECPVPRVAESGPRLLRTLRNHVPVRSIWANDAMKCWRSHTDCTEQVQNVEQILQTMLDMCDKYPALEPDRYSYGFLASAWTHHAKETNNVQSMEHAEQCLSDMWNRWEASRSTRQYPGLILYQTVFRGWMKLALANRAAEPQAYKKALSLLVEMKELYEDGFTEFKPDTKFQDELKLIRSHVRNCDIASLPTIEAIARGLEASYGDKRLGAEELKIFANNRREMIGVYMQNERYDLDQTMSRVLPLLHDWLEVCCRAKDPFTRLNTIYMSKCITATGRSDAKDAFLRSQALLDEMWNLHYETGDDALKPDGIAYGTLMNVLSNSNLEDAGERAHELLGDMWGHYNRDRLQNKALKPDAVAYSTAIRVWSKSKHPDAGERAAWLLGDMWKSYHKGDKDMKPSNVQYNQVMGCVGPNRAKHLLKEMWDLHRDTNDETIKPNRITYNSLIKVLSETENAAEQTEALLREMWDLYNKDETENQALKPDAISYGSVIRVWAKSKDKNAGDHAERLLQDMWDGYNGGDKDMKPTNVEYSQVILAMSGSDGVRRAEALLQRMWNLYRVMGDDSIKPDRITYGSLMNVLSASNTKDAGERAEGLLRDMWDRYNQDRDRSLKPNAISYGSAIQAWERSGDKKAGDNAERLLRDMRARFEAGDKDLEPTTIHYNHVVSAIQSVGGGDSVTRSAALLQEMRNHHGWS